MVPELEKPRVTEIQVRMDCNGCVQKIKKALHGINGIYDIYIDIPQQKLTIIGWADPEKIVKAIKKTRKAATIYSDIEAAPPTEPPSEGGAPPPDPASPPPAEAVPQEEPAEPPKEPASQENPPPEATPEPTQAPAPPAATAAPAPAAAHPCTDSTGCQLPQPSGSKEAEEVHVVYHYPPDHSYGYSHGRNNVPVYNGRVDHYPSTPNPGCKNDPPQPIHVNHSYNTYKPTPYVTEYKYIRPPPQYTYYSIPGPLQQYTNYNRPEPPHQYTHYNKPEPPQHYTHYSGPEPPQQYTPYSRPEPPQEYTNYRRPDPLPQYTHYSGQYHSTSNGNGNITSTFSDENPNACRIV